MPVGSNIPKITSLLRKWVPGCANPHCQRNSFWQSALHRDQGMNFEDGWYCDPNCVDQTIQGKIEELMTSQGRPAKPRSSRVPLGLLLLSRGVLTSEQLKIALEHQRSSEGNFGDAVQRLGFATGEQVTAAVAAQWACPVFSMGDRRLDVQAGIPRYLLELCGILPVHFVESERRLMVGFVNAVQYQVLYTIGHMTACTVTPCFITARDYESHLHSPSTLFLRDHELVFEQVVETGEMARTIRSHVVQLGAKQIRLGKCRDYLWTRVSGPNGEMNLLFRMRSP
jgi:hypothetical protein